MHIESFINKKQIFSTIDKQGPSNQTERKSSGLICEALCEALGSLLKEYRVMICAFESQFKLNQITLQGMVTKLYPSLKLLQGIEDVVTEIEQKNAKGVCPLIVLFDIFYCIRNYTCYK